MNPVYMSLAEIGEVAQIIRTRNDFRARTGAIMTSSCRRVFMFGGISSL